MTTIHPIKTGVVRNYLIVEEGAILIDCGPPGQAKNIERQLRRLTTDPTDVRLIVLTHSHADHAGRVNELRELTGAEVVLGSADRGWLEQGVVIVPTPTNSWGKFVAAMFKVLMLPFVRLPEPKRTYLSKTKNSTSPRTASMGACSQPPDIRQDRSPSCSMAATPSWEIWR